MIRLTLDPGAETVTLRLAAFLGGDRFASYRDVAVRNGARYVSAEKANRAPVSAVPGLLRDLAEAGLATEVDSAVADVLAEQAAEATALLDEGRARLDAADARLAERGLALYPFQRTGVEWLAPRAAALLTDEMGLGKTVQALLALPEGAAALVVVPSAVRHSWKIEVEKWRPDLEPVVVTSRATFRWPAEGEVVVATYGMLPDAEAIPGMAPVGTYLVADEAHALKNRKALRTRRFAAVVEHVVASRGRVWLVTGTPLLNRPPELWQLLSIAGLAEAAFGNWYGFARAFNGARGRYGYEWGRPDESVPDSLRRVMLHRRRREVLPDLPTKTRVDVPVNGLDATTKRLADAAWEKIAPYVDADDPDALARAASGSAFEELSRARAALAASKISDLLELVAEYEEAEEPLVVFSYHTAPVEAVGTREGWGLITGATSADERGRIVEAFQRGELRGIAGTIGALGVGVTLTAAHHLILVDLAWTPALNQQAEDRVCRIGQDRGVIVKRLVANHPLDARVLELLTIKQQIIEASVEASAVEADYLGESPAAALASAAEAARKAAVDLEALRVAEEEKVRERAAEAAREARERLGENWDGRDLDVRGTFRSAANAVEDHAAAAMLQLAGHDSDRALVKNDIGFSRYDGDFGHSLADSLRTHGRLSDRQWAAAVKLARKYRRQVGVPPTETVD